jgi:hypothetical protein
VSYADFSVAAQSLNSRLAADSGPQEEEYPWWIEDKPAEGHHKQSGLGIDSWTNGAFIITAFPTIAHEWTLQIDI